ncbi:O-antigen ligase family protein [Pseudoalteromonas sp. G4]|uniref:O-antigen ligase family protein n=1 Tax=Pseudoalteromonas sp. G4 TaxID=2992761 RepID=UPI00237DEDD8|nr:O-antigen ligase family protein [Pseudoalteromonas sp. G4]MDE3270648.1 O-antigen ligase family protein [Pseudoalteromonas sp. G4]
MQIRKGYIFAVFPIFYVLLVARASLDPVLNYTKVGGIGLGALLNLLLACLFLLLLLKKNSIPKILFFPWVIFSFLTIISSFWSPNFIQSLRSSFWVITYMSVFFIPFFFNDPKKFFVSVLYLIAASFIVPFLSVCLELVTNTGGIVSGEYRISSTFSHPNIFAFYLTQVLLSVLALRTLSLREKENIFGSNIGLLLIGVLFLLIILTQTRSAWAITLILLAVHCSFNERRLIVPALISLLCIAAFPPVTERIVDALTSSETYYDPYATLNSFEWRLVVWKSAIPWILESFWLGHGFNSFGYYFLDFIQLEEENSFDAHNMYVQYIFDLGFIGLASYLILVIIVSLSLVSGRKIHCCGSLIVTSFFTYSMCGLSDNISFYLSFNWYFWLLIGAYLALVFKGVVAK